MNLKSSFWLHYITLHAGWAEWYYMESNANANPTNEWAGVRVYYMSTVFIEFIWKYHKVSYLIESNRKFMRNTNDIWCSLSPIMYPGLGWESNEYIQDTAFWFFPFHSSQYNAKRKTNSTTTAAERSGSQQHRPNNDPLNMGSADWTNGVAIK